MGNDAAFLPECSRQVRALIHRADPRSVTSRKRWHASRRTVLSLLNITLIEVEIFSDAHNKRIILAGQHGLLARPRQTRLELSTAGSERAAQDYDQAACNEVHVASANKATEMSTAQTVQIKLSFGFSRAVGSASDTSNDKVLYQPINPIARQSVCRKHCQKSSDQHCRIPVRSSSQASFWRMSTFSKSDVHSSRSRTLVSALLLNTDERIAITTKGLHGRLTHPSLFFVFGQVCVTGAVQTAPVTAAFCSSTGGELRMGRAWDNSTIHRRHLSGISGLERSPTFRWTTLRALGLQLPKTAAVPASSSGRSSNSGLRSTRMPHIRRRVCVPWHSSACPLRSRWLP